MKLFEIILSLTLAIFGIITELKWKKIGWTKRLLGIGSIILSIVIGYNQYKENQNEERTAKINAHYGDLDATDAYFPIFEIGNSGSKFLLNSGWFSFEQCPNLFNVTVVDNKLFFSTVIYNKDGKAIAAIDKNTWTEYEDGEYEYNYDDNAFEIVTAGSRRVYFHIELKDSVAHGEGLLYSEKKYGFYFFDTSKEGAFLVIRPDANFEVPDYIKPIFKYPREKYIGERTE